MVHWHVDPEEVNDDDRQKPNEVQKSLRTISADDVLPKTLLAAAEADRIKPRR